MRMKKKAMGIFLLALALVFLSGLKSASSQQTAEELYEAALLKKEAEGDLSGAIQLFQRIVETFPQNRDIGAKAQLQIGMCYEKLGLEQAREAFRKVVEEYPEQTQAVTTAREKLSILVTAQNLLETGAGEIRIRKVWDNALDGFFTGSPSPDGRHISYVNWVNFANLGIHNLETGENRQLTTISSWESGEFVYESVFSPDGDRIAYSFQTKEGFIQLRTVNADGSSIRIIHDGRDVTYLFPACWSGDGKEILTVLYGEDHLPSFSLISVEDGSVNNIKSLAYPLLSNPRVSLSPDGKVIICSFPPKGSQGNSDIFLFSIDGSRQETIIEHPADDEVLGWSPTGDQVFFTSDRAGNIGVWVVGVSDGNVKGLPKLIRGDMGNIRPMGMLGDGSFVYGIHSGWSDIFVAEIDPESGELMVPPEKAIRIYESFNSAPAWSPDGNLLACRSTRGKTVNEIPGLLFMSTRTNEIRELTPKVEGGLNFHFLTWSPDGSSVLAIGRGVEKYGVLFAIDVQSGDAEIIAHSDQEDPIFGPEWTPDGRTIYFWRMGKEFRRVIRLDVEKGAEKELLRFPTGSGSFQLRVSPDGGHLAISDGSKIVIFTPESAESKELIHEALNLGTLDWSSDGKHILFGKRREGSEDIIELWRVPVEGGKSQNLGLSMPRIMHLSVHPDGHRIAFTASEQQARNELWIMEGFLGEEK